MMRRDPRAALLPLALALLINTPSIKLFTGATPIVNAVALAILGAAGVRRYADSGWDLTTRKYAIIGALSAMVALIVLPEYLGIRGGIATDPIDAISLLAIVMIAVVVLATATTHDVVRYTQLQVGWGVFVALAYSLELFQLAPDEGFHYNTVMVPIALAMCILIAYLIHPDQSVSLVELVGAAIAFGVMLLTVVALHSRGIYIGVAGATVAGVALLAWRSPTTAALTIIGRTVGVFVFAAISLWLLIQQGYMSTIIVDRMTQLIYATGESSRAEIYTTAMALIERGPWGYGLGSYEVVTGTPYPHNMILHAAIAGGWLAAICLTGAIMILVADYLRGFTDTMSPNALAIGMVGVYLLFIFSVSYSLTHTYILFAALCSAANIRKHRATVAPRMGQIEVSRPWKQQS